MKRLFRAALCCCGSVLVLLVVSPAGTDLQAQEQVAGGEDASTGSRDADQVIAYPMGAVLRAAKLALDTYGCEVKKETPDSLECTRSRHIGVFLGSGGEKVTVRVSPNGNDTRVRINTGKGMLGRLGKKNWSTPVFNELLKNLKDS